MIKLTRFKHLLMYHGKIVGYMHNLNPWNIPADVKKIWINVSLKPGGTPYDVQVLQKGVFSVDFDLPSPLAFEIFKKVKMYGTTTIYLEVYYA